MPAKKFDLVKDVTQTELNNYTNHDGISTIDKDIFETNGSKPDKISIENFNKHAEQLVADFLQNKKDNISAWNKNNLQREFQKFIYDKIKEKIKNSEIRDEDDLFTKDIGTSILQNANTLKNEDESLYRIIKAQFLNEILGIMFDSITEYNDLKEAITGNNKTLEVQGETTTGELTQLYKTIIKETGSNNNIDNLNENLPEVTEPTANDFTEDGMFHNLLRSGGSLNTNPQNYTFKYRVTNGGTDRQDDIPQGRDSGSYTVERAIFDKEGNKVGSDKIKNKRNEGKVDVRISPVITDDSEGQEIVNTDDSSVGDEKKKTTAPVTIEYDKTSGDDQENNDNRSKREKRRQKKALKKAKKKRDKAEKLVKRKGEKKGVQKVESGEEHKYETTDHKKITGSTIFERRLGKKIDKANMFENQAHTSQQEKYTRKKEGKALFELVLGKESDFQNSFKKIEFQKDFARVFSDAVLEASDITSAVKQQINTLTNVDHKRQFIKLSKNISDNGLTKEDIKTLRSYLLSTTNEAAIIEDRKAKELLSNAKKDNILNILADFDNSGFNNLTVEKKTFGGAVRKMGSEAELLEAFKDNFDMTEDLTSFDNGQKTQHAIKVMVEMLLTKDYKSEKIKGIFYENDALELQKCTLENLANLFKETPEFRGIYRELLDNKCSYQELSDIIAGNERLRSDISAQLEYSSILEAELATRKYRDEYALGDKDKLPYDELGTGQYQSLKSFMFQFGTVMDSTLSYLANLDFGKISASLTTNEEKIQYKELLKLTEGGEKKMKERIKEKVLKNKISFTSIVNELSDINTSRDAGERGNKIIGLVSDLLGGGIKLNLLSCKMPINVNAKKTQEQNMYDNKGLKSFDFSLSAGVQLPRPRVKEKEIKAEFGAGVSFNNDKIKGIERNTEHAINKIREAIKNIKITKTTPKEIGNEIFDIIKNENDPFFKNNLENFEEFFTHTFPSELSPFENLLKDSSKSEDVKKILAKSVEGFILALRANAIRKLDQHTNIAGGGVDWTVNLLKPKTWAKIFTLGFNIHLKSYQMKWNMNTADLHRMEEELKKGTYQTDAIDLTGESGEILAKNFKKALGLASVDVSWNNKQLEVKGNDKQLHELVNIWDCGASNWKYEKGVLYIGQVEGINLLQQRLFDRQGTNIFLCGKDKEGNIIKGSIENAKNNKPIKEDYNTGTVIEGLSETTIHTFTKTKLENKFKDRNVEEIRNSIQGKITEDNGTLKYTENDITQDLKGKTIQITKKNPLEVEIVADSDSNSDNIDIKIIDPNQEAVTENISGFENLFTRPKRETIGFPENMDILQNEEWDGHFKYLKIQMSKLSSPGHRNLYDEYLSNINTGKYKEAINNLQTGINHILSTDFTGTTTQKNLPDQYKLENGRRAAYTLQKELFTNLQTALQNTNNTVDTQVLVDLVTEKLAYEPLIHDTENGGYSAAWLRKMRTDPDLRKQYYTKVDSYPSELTYEETRKKLEPNFQNSNLNNILDGNKHIKMEDGDPGLYVTCNYHRGVQPVYGQTFGNKIYGGKENGSLTFASGSDQEKAAGKFLSKERTANDIFYKKQVELIAKKIDPNWTADDLIAKIPIDSGGNLFFDEDGNKRESLTFTIDDTEYTINLEDTEVRFCLVGTCANETFALILNGISATKKNTKGKETNFHDEGDITPNAYALSATKGVSSVTASVSAGVLNHYIGVRADIDLTKPETTPPPEDEEAYTKQKGGAPQQDDEAPQQDDEAYTKQKGGAPQQDDENGNSK